MVDSTTPTGTHVNVRYQRDYAKARGESAYARLQRNTDTTSIASFGDRTSSGLRGGRFSDDRVVGRHQCTSIRGGCSSRCMSINRHRASAATTPITTKISESAAPYAYSPLSNARR